jgi:hypothetical protein
MQEKWENWMLVGELIFDGAAKEPLQKLVVMFTPVFLAWR